ncbi:hypothetical protein TRFO_31709 [Tritrichomonas foetus]|uniref:Arf-GAP domain-containing protein n=1 Tax=Tritrichomonas foetus TaxID=1144522 RepID=A0A1J4JSS1_9EUKA|nr:hypothetical protein TRFO_31709 [Tritrichomonas foetus]|eukprot:OHT01480.1 hypothetical protein TRFO_31709 [Tritrichomonas foetus]
MSLSFCKTLIKKYLPWCHFSQFFHSRSIPRFTISDMSKNIEKKIRTLMHKEGNEKCIDCFDPCALFIDLEYGIFLCEKCSEIHKEIGSKIINITNISVCDSNSKKKNTIPTLEKELDSKILDKLNSNSNSKFNSKYMALYHPNDEISIPFGSDYVNRRLFIISKYIEKKWFSSHPSHSHFFDPTFNEIEAYTGFPSIQQELDLSLLLSSSEESQISSPLDLPLNSHFLNSPNQSILENTTTNSIEKVGDDSLASFDDFEFHFADQTIDDEDADILVTQPQCKCKQKRLNNNNDSDQCKKKYKIRRRQASDQQEKNSDDLQEKANVQNPSKRRYSSNSLPHDTLFSRKQIGPRQSLMSWNKRKE